MLSFLCKTILYVFLGMLALCFINQIAPMIFQPSVLIGAGIVLGIIGLLWLLSKANHLGADPGSRSESGFHYTDDGFVTQTKARMRYERNLGYRRESEAVDALFGSLSDRAHRK
jgi:hypothetical protein